MGKFICTCGSPVRTSGAIPNPNEWHLIADEDFDPDLSGMDLLGCSILAWRCPACGRLWLEGGGRVKDSKQPGTLWEYVPAFDDPGPLAPSEADSLQGTSAGQRAAGMPLTLVIREYSRSLADPGAAGQAQFRPRSPRFPS